MISFANPQDSKTHTLIIKQTTGFGPSNLFSYVFNMPEQDSNFLPVQMPLRPASTTEKVYTWFYKVGIVPTFDNTFPLTTTTFSVTSGNSGISLSPDRKTLALGNGTTPFISMFEVRKGDAENKYSRNAWFGFRNSTAPGAAAGSLRATLYHPSSPVIFLASGTTPFAQCFYLDNTNRPIAGIGGNPDTLPTGAAECLDLSPRGDLLAVGHATSPFISLYYLNLGDKSVS